MAAPASVPPDKLTEELPATAVIVPAPQEPDKAFGVATTNPAGSVSVKDTPLIAKVAFSFSTLNVKLVLAPRAIVPDPNSLLIAGGELTWRLAVDVLPVPPLVEVTVTELDFPPDVVAVTLTEKVQVAFAASVAPERATDDDPAVAVMVPPPQLPESPLGAETTRPACRVSAKAMPFRLLAAFGLVMVKLRLVAPFRATEAAPKDLVMDGAPVTFSVAMA